VSECLVNTVLCYAVMFSLLTGVSTGTFILSATFVW